ncbi:glycosyltransferase family 4 protein [Leptolyngbya sp. NIES-2104]|uniref:glycosyltransferase family 4 protein n=1 Tax=Leptolyngbya sp. NIES-2104 TaxID=1552121 RepID=UPI0006EC4AF5|nr:glycosyltransferase family 4 protein [Leptolyngbya sp. NIES-2104]GAP94467.1 UDP-glucose:tetrahydrobiopterin glucosyltransferase [Leptolyngbya sp. NIES-2104]
MSQLPKLNLLLLSTPVGAIGSGLGGGVELTLTNIARSLINLGHAVTVVAPEGSVLDGIPLVQIPGNLQITAQSQGRDAPITLPANSVLSNCWNYARQVQHQYDVIINFAYDWLPFYLTPFFDCPIAHLVSMGSLTDAMDHIIGEVAEQFPNAIAVHSLAQADTFSFRDRCFNLKNGFDLSQYQFNSTPNNHLAWVGRIAPEKGLEDAVAAVQQLGIPLKIWGVIQDKTYWNHVRSNYPNAPIEYCGFLSTQDLQQALGQSRALLMTPHWIEAFGNVAIEALACGVPVIAYRRGGPAEIVKEGETGWLVEPDSITGLVEAISKLEKIDRANCRLDAEREYSLSAMGKRLEIWLDRIVQSHNLPS